MKTFLNSVKKVREKASTYLGLAPGLLSKIMPKKSGLEIFGSFRGSQVGDNSLALYEEKSLQGIEVFFITKSIKATQIQLAGGHYPILAYSIRGLWLQLRAETAFYSHAVFDFVSPLIVGSRIVCLQHGFPVKIAGAAARKVEPNGLPPGETSVLTRAKQFTRKYRYHYYCDEVWTPGGLFEVNTRKIFADVRPSVVIATPPRLRRVVVQSLRTRILLAPTGAKGRTFEERLVSWGLHTSESPTVRLLRKLGLSLVMRPHPGDVAEALDCDLAQEVTLDTSTDVYNSLGSYGGLISDASSIAFDAIALGIPVRFLVGDFQYFQTVYNGLFPNVIPLVQERISDSILEALVDVHLEAVGGSQGTNENHSLSTAKERE